MRRFEEKVIVVAGGGTGIGAGTCVRLASEGATVIVGDVSLENAEKTSQEIVDAGGIAKPVEFDLADEPSIAALINGTVEEYGKIDGLHCNGAALQLTPDDTDIVTVDLELWEQTFRVNLTGYMLCMRHAIPPMLERGEGAIVCTTSGAGVQAIPNMPAYGASKAGVNSLVRHVASRYGKEGIRCNALMPGGLIRTPSMETNSREEYLEPAERIAFLSRYIGEPSDMAAMVAFLLSSDASWVTGQVYALGGGGFTFN